MSILFFDKASIRSNCNVIKTCFKEAFSTKSNNLKNIFISSIPVAGYLFTMNKDWLESEKLISSNWDNNFVESIKWINAKNYNKIFLIINKLVLGILLIPVSGYFLCLTAVASIPNFYQIIKNHSVIEKLENHYTFMNPTLHTFRHYYNPTRVGRLAYNLLETILPWVDGRIEKKRTGSMELHIYMDVTVY